VPTGRARQAYRVALQCLPRASLQVTAPTLLEALACWMARVLDHHRATAVVLATKTTSCLTDTGVCWGVVPQLGVPAQVFIAPGMADGDTCRKPATGMWDFMTSDCNGGIKPGEEQWHVSTARISFARLQPCQQAMWAHVYLSCLALSLGVEGSVAVKRWMHVRLRHVPDLVYCCGPLCVLPWCATDRKASFYVGDAAGRLTDHSNTDKWVPSGYTGN
jgi:hypothetical protein